jgi:tetratricopeptide (TPR) repeat protein
VASSQSSADDYYNLLVQGFSGGQLSVKREAPPWLAQVADPYNLPTSTDFSVVNDLSYYKGKLYLYFGVTPAVVLFWPYETLTGRYLPQQDAAVIFCSVGFLVSVGLLLALRRRYFAEVSAGVVMACTLPLGMATLVPAMFSGNCGVYEVAISCGYMLTMLALAAIWKALREPQKRLGWMAAASAAYGLAVGARPSLLFGAVILLVPVLQAWRERRQIWAPLAAATGPIVLIGLGLMLYNALRFDNPFEFGQHYQLNGQQMVTAQFFSLHYLWFNFRVYFLEPAHWSVRFPFVHRTVVSPLPPGHGAVEEALGILTNIPLVWLALAVPLAWRNRSGQLASVLRWFVMAGALFFGSCALTLGFYWWVGIRYAVDFLPALVLLAAVGIFGLERVLADRPVWRRAARLGWSLLLSFSMAFNLLVSVENYAHAECALASVLLTEGRVPEAIQIFEKALPITPDDAYGHARFAVALQLAGKVREAIGQYEQALRIQPDFAYAHYNLGNALLQADKVREAITHFEQALRLKPDYAEAHCNLGVALAQTGKIEEAIAHYEHSLRIEPDNAEAQYNLGNALVQAGRVQDGIGHYEHALRSEPDNAEAHCNLGVALAQTGKIEEAIAHYEHSLRIKPDYAEAHNNLGIVLAQTGKIEEAIAHFEQALRIKPDFAEAHCNLGNALRLVGRVQDAIGQYGEALRNRPDYAEAHYALGMALEQTGRVQEGIGHYEQALRIKPDYAEAQNALKRLQAGQ